MKSVISFKVRYPETDRMGIVYHANYYPWFELGRLDFIEMFHMTYADMENRGLLMPVTETHCKYIKSSTFGDEVSVETELSKLTVARCEFKYRVLRAGDVIAEGKTVHAFADTKLVVINLKKRFPEVWEAFSAMLEEN